MRVSRIDRSSIKLDKLPRTGAGAVRVPATVARTGVQVYDGLREYRPDSEVFAADSLASLASVPVTYGHPPQGVNPTNSREYQRGHVTDAAPESRVRVDGSEDEWVKTHLIVSDAEVLDAVAAGGAEVSAGYSCDLETTPGVTPNGERYDAVQRNILFNHVAILPPETRARAGAHARLRNDGDKEDMKVIVIDGVEYEFGSERHIERLDALAEARVGAERARADKAEAERDAEKSRADKAEADRKADADRLDDAVSARHSLVSSAARLLPAEYDIKNKTDADIRKDACEAVLGADTMKDKSTDYIAARFDGLAGGQEPGAPAQYHNPAADSAAPSRRKLSLDNDDEFRAHLAKCAKEDK